MKFLNIQEAVQILFDFLFVFNLRRADRAFQPQKKKAKIAISWSNAK